MSPCPVSIHPQKTNSNLRRRASLPGLSSSPFSRLQNGPWAWLDLSAFDSFSANPSTSHQSDCSTSEKDGIPPSVTSSTASTPQSSCNQSSQLLQSSPMSREPCPPQKILRNRDRFHRVHSNRTLPSANVYIRPLPPSFDDVELEALCLSATSPLKSPNRHKIVSVKVMIEEDESIKIGVCKGYGFCLWNSIEAASLCIDGLRARGYQASFARETSRGMLSSLADISSANIYLSNLPHDWVEKNLIDLFGDTQISSFRLLRDRDDESVGTGISRGVGFVRLVNRKEALHYVQKLHGLAVDGKDHHIQCRMADSKAQKEWKRRARSRHDQPLLHANNYSEGTNFTGVKTRSENKSLSEKPANLKQCGPHAPLAPIRLPSFQMSSNLPSFAPNSIAPIERPLPPTRLTPTAAPFEMPVPETPFSSLQSDLPCSANAVHDFSESPISPLSHSSHSSHSNQTSLSASEVNFATGWYPGCFMGPSFPYTHASSPINFFYLAGDSPQVTYPKELLQMPSPDFQAWDTGMPQMYAHGAATCLPSPLACCSAPSTMSSSDVDSDQARAQLNADSDSWNCSE